MCVRKCSCCGKEFEDGELYNVYDELGGYDLDYEYLCYDCMDLFTYECDECGRRVIKECAVDMSSDALGEIYWCESCYEWIPDCAYGQGIEISLDEDNDEDYDFGE